MYLEKCLLKRDKKQRLREARALRVAVPTAQEPVTDESNDAKIDTFNTHNQYDNADSQLIFTF